MNVLISSYFTLAVSCNYFQSHSNVGASSKLMRRVHYSRIDLSSERNRELKRELLGSYCHMLWQYEGKVKGLALWR